MRSKHPFHPADFDRLESRELLSQLVPGLARLSAQTLAHGAVRAPVQSAMRSPRAQVEAAAITPITPIANLDMNLNAIYADAQNGANSVELAAQFPTVRFSGNLVGISIRARSNVKVLVSELTKLGATGLFASSTYLTVQGYVPVKNLPAIAALDQTVSGIALYKPIFSVLYTAARRRSTAVTLAARFPNVLISGNQVGVSIQARSNVNVLVWNLTKLGATGLVANRANLTVQGFVPVKNLPRIAALRQTQSSTVLYKPLLLATAPVTTTPMANLDMNLNSIYASFANGASPVALAGQFPTVQFSGDLVGVSIRAKSDVNVLASELTNLGGTVQTTSSAYLTVQGFVPISKLPALAALDQTASGLALYKPILLGPAPGGLPHGPGFFFS